MEISENPGFMYGQNFKNFSKYVRIAAGIHQKSQNLLGLPIWPQICSDWLPKWQFRSDHFQTTLRW